MIWWLAQNTLLAGLLAIFATLACRFVRLSPAMRHALWLVVLLKLISPPLALYVIPARVGWTEWLLPETASSAQRQLEADERDASGVGVQVVDAFEPAMQDWREVEIRIEEHSQQIEPGGGPFVEVDNRPLLPLEPVGETSVASAASPDPIENADRASGSTAAKLASGGTAVWLIGTTIIVLVQATRLSRLRRILIEAELAPQGLIAQVQEIAQQLGVGVPHVVVSARICSPVICALGRPRLVWPKVLLESLAGEARRTVIVHELAHLRRRDHWIGWLELAASCAWWWNPLFWHVRNQLRENAELACDAWVIAIEPGGRRAYAQALIEVSELISWAAPPAPAVGMGAIARRTFERRLTMILRERVPCRAPLLGLAMIGLVGLAVLPGWSQGQAPAIDPFDIAPSSDTAISERQEAADPKPVADTQLEDRPATTEEQATEAPRSEGFLDSLTQPVQQASPQAPGTTPIDEPISKAPATEAHPAAERVLRRAVSERVREAGERNRFLVQIQELEARLAELSAQVKALGGEVGPQTQFYNRHDGGPLDIFSNPIPARTRPSLMVIDLKETPGSQVIKLSMFVDQHVKLRLIDNLKLARVEIDTPETIRIAEQSPKELELVAVHPGGAMARLFDDQDRVYKVHADVVSSGTTGAMSQKRQALFNHGYAVARTAKEAPDRGESVENLTRARYKLPQATAEALAVFLKQHAKSEIEIKVEGETVIVTASPDDQSRIGQFIHLLGPATERRAQPAVREESSNDSLAPPFGRTSLTPEPGREPTPIIAPGVEESPASQPATFPAAPDAQRRS